MCEILKNMDNFCLKWFSNYKLSIFVRVHIFGWLKYYISLSVIENPLHLSHKECHNHSNTHIKQSEMYFTCLVK